jgi:hypothetical protein
MADCLSFVFTRLIPAEALHRASRTWSVIVIFVLTLLADAATAQTRVISVQLLPNTCSVMQDLLDDVGAEFTKVAGSTTLVSKPILDRLSSAGIETIEVFFRCFEFEEARAFKRYEAQGVSRVITTDIRLARVQFKKHPFPEVREQVVCVAFIIKQKTDGTLLPWGGYNNCA